MRHDQSDEPHPSVALANPYPSAEAAIQRSDGLPQMSKALAAHRRILS